jgi:hypothetical protein
MIRNNAGGSAVRDTAKLIETLKKVGVIKTKKRRARRSLAKDEIRQDNDMGPGFAVSAPPQFGASPQQQDYNAQRIEDIQRQSGNQIMLLKNEIQKLRGGEQQSRIMPQQRLKNDDVSSLRIEQMPSAPRVRGIGFEPSNKELTERRGQPYLETNEFTGDNSGPQPDQGSAKAGTVDYDMMGRTIFAGDDEEEAITIDEPDTPESEPATYKGGLKPDQIVSITEIHKSKDLQGTIQRVSEMGINVSDINLKDKIGVIKEKLKTKVRQFLPNKK